MAAVFDGDGKAIPPGRTPGKYIVYGMLFFGAIFLVFMVVLAFRLSPAADRFHNNPSVPTKPK